MRNLKINFAIDTLESIFSKYGERTKLARINQSVDWKALSHALRVGYQTYHILHNGGFEYPLPENYFLLDVKQGVLDFLYVEEKLTQLVYEIEQLTQVSDLPDDVDREYWDTFICDIHLDIINN